MKRVFIIAIFLLIVSIDLVSASFSLANYSIETNYGPGENLRGWLNISLKEEPADSLLNAFDSKISILDFLEKANSNYECFPADCEANYIASNKATTKSFSLNFAEKKIIGLKLTGKIDSINSFSMNITSDAPESAYPQLFIDILNDNEVEWQSYAPSGNFGNENHGCYSDGIGQAEITQTEYCEKITLPYSSNIKIGANINAVAGKGGNVNFEMRIYNDEYDEICIASASGSGKISCAVDLTTKKEQDFFVCIRTKNSADDSKYSINYEQNEPCGFSDIYDDNYEYDFDIFAQAGKYKATGTFILNNKEIENMGLSADLISYIGDYINEKYNNNCTNSCIVPIKFMSGKQQTLTISDVSLTYTSGITKTTYELYDVEEDTAKINMAFQKLNLQEADLKVPMSYGEKILSLRLSDEEILNNKIKIAKVPVIDFVTPLELPAIVSVKFIVFASGNVTKYVWDFGDGTKETTKENVTYHTYSKTGNYSLKITATNEAGEASKSFELKVRTPKDEIKRALEEKMSNLNKTKKQLEEIKAWYKEKLEKEAALEDIKDELERIANQYETASDEDYVKIMSSLLEIEVPHSLKSIKSSGDFFPSIENVNPIYLEELVGEVENVEKYREPIINWFNENIESRIENEKFYLYYNDKKEALFTVFTLKIKPKKQLEETYLIIDKSYDEITFKPDGNYNEKAVGAATAITFPEIEKDEEKIIEFILPEKIEIMELPLYISPKFSELPETGEIGPCNNNDICEKERGETKKNCLNDCWERPWGKIILYFLILLFIAFFVYIALQEWYKRYYEGHLFKNKNDIYNLINFIINAQNQGLGRGDIIKKLKQHGWSSEQIVYAYKKVLGQRTGMWEIPIFRAFEKRRLRKELEKRRRLGMLQYLAKQEV